MILHILPDNTLMGTFTHNIQLLSNGGNAFVSPKWDHELHNHHLHESAQIVRWNSKELNNILVDSKYSRIVFHYLSLECIDLLNSNMTLPTVEWVFWGSDYFRFTSQKLLDSHTAQLQKQNKWAKRFYELKKMAADKSFDGLKYAFPKKQKFHTAIQRISSIYHFSSDDISDLLQNFSHITFKKFLYPLPQFQDINVSKKSQILLGNSADPTNNHLDVLERIQQTQYADHKVLIPLSYGNPIYAKSFIKLAKKRFGHKLQFLTELLPPKDYYSLIGQSELAIMGHKRSQALGNYIPLLYNDIPVFTHTNHGIYKFFNRSGVAIQDINMLDQSVTTDNRSTIQSLYSASSDYYYLNYFNDK